MANVVMIVGYPAAGKSAIAQGYIDHGYTILNRDTEGGTISALVPKMVKLIRQYTDVVLDNTFPTKQVRKQFIEACKDNNTPIYCNWVNSSIEEAQFNACQRMIKTRGKLLSSEEIKKEKSPNMFPPMVQFKYRKEFEEPSEKEGFGMVTITEFERRFPPNWKNKALFLDYDGTLRTTKSDKKWPTKPNDIQILPNRRAVLDYYKSQGYILLGVSNQSGIRKDNPTEEQAIVCFDKTNTMLGHKIDYKYCPHRPAPISCYCRKPMPGMAIEFFHKYKLDPTQCIMVGDMTSDETFAKRSHMQFVHADEFFKS